MNKRGVVLDGTRLVRLYHRKGWSQQDLARKTGLDARTIAKVKRGGTCDASTLQLLCQALGVEPEDLLAAEPGLSPNGFVATPPPAAPTFRQHNRLSQSLRFIQVWKIVDLRNPYLHGDIPSGVVVEQYRLCKHTEEQPQVTFPYLTWGDGIECLAKPDGAAWTKVPVERGDVVHCDNQWELTFETPIGPAGTQFDCGPIALKFVNAFHGEGQQWWQTRAGHEIESLVIQILFAPDQPCFRLEGTCAMPGQRKFTRLEDNEPFLLPDGSVANWHIQKPPVGTFYKLAWAW